MIKSELKTKIFVFGLWIYSYKSELKCKFMCKCVKINSRIKNYNF